MANFKKPIVQSKKLREGGRGQSCVMPGCSKPCHSGAHLPMHSAGFGGRSIKAPDYLLADLCMDHHNYADGEGRRDWEFRFQALALTLERRFYQGLLTVPGEDHSWELFL